MSNNITYVTAFNYGYVEFAANNIANYIYTLNDGYCKLHLTALDELAYTHITAFIDSISQFDTSTIVVKKNYLNIQNAATFNSGEFISITRKKLEIILQELLENKLIHFLDGDVYFFKNPRSIILEKISESDVVFQQDSPRAHNHPLYSNYVCTGNFSSKSNANSIKLFESLLKIDNYTSNDQELLYNHLNSKCDNIRDYKDCLLDVYDPELFQNGYDAFKESWFLKQNKICIHANHMIGKEVKMQALKDINAWLIE